jgi:hypothetical protein
MRPQTNNEKMLLWVLGAVIFLGGSYLGYGWLADTQKKLDRTYAGLRVDQEEAKVDLMQSDTWTKIKAWTQEHQPTMGDEGDAKAQVLEDALKGARANKLEIVNQSLNDVEHGGAGTSVFVTVKVKGSMQDLCKWLTTLEKPEQFYAISSFTLNADQDQKSMDCEVQIARYFKSK